MYLKKGDRGNSVKYVQQGLRMLCINPNGTDGIFGAGTENAVKKFQTNSGISATGIVDDTTWNAMKNRIIPIQQALISAGYNIGAADGVAGDKTYNSIIDFQRNHGLTADGMVGEKTREKLFSSSAVKNTSAILKVGSKGEEVRKVQSRLIELGYSCGSAGADGDFGQGTYNAVVAFQKNNQLDPDGIVGERTREKLFSSLAVRNNNSIVLKKGMSGAEVKKMQSRLIELGYSCGPAGADGEFGTNTYTAVYEFQRCNGLVTDGIAGEKTLGVLYSENAVRYTPNTNISINPGNTNNVYVGSLVEYTIQVILHGEGNYTAINDSDPISIGILQWYEGRAHDLLAIMYERDSNTVESILGKNSTLVSEIKMDRSVFVGRFLSKEEKTVMRELLGSSLGRAVQYEMAVNDVSGYIEDGKKKGIEDEKALIYYSDLYNQSPKQAKIIVESLSGDITLYKLHNAAMKNGVMNVYYSRRENAYNEANKYESIQGELERFVNIALGEYGYKEGKSNITKYGEWYGYNGEPWCAMFVSWCASQAGILRTSANPSGLVPKYDAVSAGMNDYIARGKFGYKESYTPKYGDIMFLKSAGASHTAIVVGYEKATNKVYTIEGNFQDSVCKVWRYADFNKITGYGINGGMSNGMVLNDAVSADGGSTL